MTVAAILEAGRPKGSLEASSHECAALGVYLSLDGECVPFSCANRGRIALSMTEQDSQDDDLWAMPTTQYVLRGEETVEGATRTIKKNCGRNAQRIDPADDNVLWQEIQVWIGIPQYAKVRARPIPCPSWLGRLQEMRPACRGRQAKRRRPPVHEVQ